MMKTKFNTDDFLRAHGKSPKGTGLWFFTAVGHDGSGSFTDLGTQEVHGTFTQAKREAKQAFVAEAEMCGRVKEVTVFVGS